jgi:hypothetical protein
MKIHDSNTWFIAIFLLLSIVFGYTYSFKNHQPIPFSAVKYQGIRKIDKSTRLFSETIISPFVNDKNNNDDDLDEYELSLTRENVEIVLDEMRPYLQADG